MAHRCPKAKVLGVSEINDYRLLFRGQHGGAVATVEPFKGSRVPVLIWEITEEDETALDRYEGWPYLYRKENIKVKLKGKVVEAMVYIMNGNRPQGQPSIYYYSVIFDGYKAQGFDEEVLKRALENSIERLRVEKDEREN